MFGGTAATTPATITIAADSISLSDRVVIEAVSADAAPEGNITLNVDTLLANVHPDGTPIQDIDGVFFNTSNVRSDGMGGSAGTVSISGPGLETTDTATLVALDKTQITTAVKGGTAATAPSAIAITADTVTLSSVRGTPVFDESIGETGIFANSSGAAPAGNIALNVRALRANVNPDGTPMERGHAFIASTSQSRESTAGPAGTITISGVSPESTDAATPVTLYDMDINNFVQGGTASTAPPTITIIQKPSL